LHKEREREREGQRVQRSWIICYASESHSFLLFVNCMVTQVANWPETLCAKRERGAKNAKVVGSVVVLASHILILFVLDQK